MSEKIITFVEFELQRTIFKNKKFATNCNIPAYLQDYTWACSACRYCLENKNPVYQNYSTEPIDKFNGKYHRVIFIRNKKIWQEMQKICNECQFKQK